MSELYIRNKKLIKESDWIKIISELESPYKNLITKKEKSIELLDKSINQAVKKRIPKERYAIAFSGGIDSTLLAFLSKKNKADFICYSVGLENSRDLQAAKKISEYYKLKTKLKTLSLKEYERIIKKTVKILKTSDVMKITVGAVVYAVLEMAKKDKIKTAFAGLGSEEIFAGYERHKEALEKNNFKKAHEECWSGLKKMHERDLVRDTTISKELGVELKTPYLDKDLIIDSMKISPELKINEKDKKIILRETAIKMGLEKEFAMRPKKAAQYGSKFVRGLDKLAKKNGFKLKKEYLKSLI